MGWWISPSVYRDCIPARQPVGFGMVDCSWLRLSCQRPEDSTLRQCMNQCIHGGPWLVILWMFTKLAGAFIVVTFILGLVNAYVAIALAYTPASIVVVGHHPLLLGFVNFLLDIPYKLIETRCLGWCKGESVPFESVTWFRNLKSGNLHFCETIFWVILRRTGSFLPAPEHGKFPAEESKGSFGPDAVGKKTKLDRKGSWMLVLRTIPHLLHSIKVESREMARSYILLGMPMQLNLEI